MHGVVFMNRFTLDGASVLDKMDFFFFFWVIECWPALGVSQRVSLCCRWVIIHRCAQKKNYSVALVLVCIPATWTGFYGCSFWADLIICQCMLIRWHSPWLGQKLRALLMTASTNISERMAQWVAPELSQWSVVGFHLWRVTFPLHWTHYCQLFLILCFLMAAIRKKRASQPWCVSLWNLPEWGQWGAAQMATFSRVYSHRPSSFVWPSNWLMNCIVQWLSSSSQAVSH